MVNLRHRPTWLQKQKWTLPTVHNSFFECKQAYSITPQHTRVQFFFAELSVAKTIFISSIPSLLFLFQ